MARLSLPDGKDHIRSDIWDAYVCSYQVQMHWGFTDSVFAIVVLIVDGPTLIHHRYS